MAGGKIFISYRRADSQWAAAWLYDHLANAFPGDHLFMDVEKIAPGQDFVDVLADQVGDCDVFLAQIGPQWAKLENEAGLRRLDDPADFVRIEIASALVREGTLTIPVLLDGAEPPAAEALPEDLAPIARRQFAKLTHEAFRQEVGPLTEAIRQALPNRPKPARAPLPLALDRVGRRGGGGGRACGGGGMVPHSPAGSQHIRRPHRLQGL